MRVQLYLITPVPCLLLKWPVNVCELSDFFFCYSFIPLSMKDLRQFPEILNISNGKINQFREL